MALSQTLTLSHGREFGGSNPGVRLDDSSDPVELDSGFFTVPDADSEVTGAFVKATFRARTAWLHLNTDLWLANIDGSPAGARNDLGVDLYSPTTDKWCRLAFSTYATKSSRSDNLAQVSFNLTTPVPTGIAGRSYQSLNDWATAVEAELPHDVNITFMSASSQAYSPPAPPAPDSVDGTFLGTTKVTEMFLGTTRVAAAFLGTKQVFGAPVTPEPAVAPGVPTRLRTVSRDASASWSWTASTGSPTGYHFEHRRVGTTSWTRHSNTGTGTARLVTGLTNGTQYEGRVRAFNDAGNSAWTSPARVTPAVPLPSTWISLASANTNPSGIWSDGTTMWVLDTVDGKLYAYTLATGVRDTTKEFDLASANDGEGGIWSNGTTMWVSDFTDDKLYAYTLSTGARDTSKEFDLTALNVFPTALWSDGTTIWVADLLHVTVFAYTLATGTRDTTKEFDTASDNTGKRAGLWSDGTTIWVGDSGDAKLYAYTLSTGARDTSKEFDLNSDLNTAPVGIWSDGTVMWVSDDVNERIYPYRLSTGAALFPTS